MLSISQRDDIPHLLDLRRWRADIRQQGFSASEADRRTYNAGAVLPHPQRAQLQAAYQEVHEHNNATGTRRMMLGVTGEFHSGKSSLVEELMLDMAEANPTPVGQFSVEDGIRNQHQPFMWVNAAASGELAFAQSMAAAVALPRARSPVKTSAPDVLIRVIEQVKRSGTRDAVFDDVNIWTSSNRRIPLTQFLKRVLNDLPATIIVVGANLEDAPVFTTVNASRADADAATQLTSRLQIMRTVQYREDNEQDLGAFRDLCRNAYTHFLLREADACADIGPQEVTDLFQASAGSVGRLFSILTHCAASAVGAEERITQPLIARTLERIPSMKGSP